MVNELIIITWSEIPFFLWSSKVSGYITWSLSVPSVIYGLWDTVGGGKGMSNISKHSQSKKKESFCQLKYLASPAEHRTTFLLQVLLNAHRTKATTATRKRFKLKPKSPITTVVWIVPHLLKVPLPHQEHEKVSSSHNHLAHKSEHLHQIEPKNAKQTH